MGAGLSMPAPTFPHLVQFFSQLGAREVGESAGSVGVCDPPANDHQWSVAVAAVSGDVTITEAHNGGTISDVCSTFAQ